MAEWIDAPSRGKDSRANLGHTFRYYMARGFLQPGDRVLDLACGCGYGSKIMADLPFVGSVLGYDIDPSGIKVANRKYFVEGKTSFEVLDLDTQANELPSCDVAVFFEMLEHLKRPADFIQAVKEKTSRLLIFSTPWKSTNSPHHRTDFFPKDELLNMVLDETWRFWERVTQGPYQVCVFYHT